MLSRRKFLAIGAAGVLAAGVGLPSLRRYRARVLSATHVPGPETDEPLETRLSNTLVDFIGALFGHDLAQQDREDLGELVAFAASADSGWIPEYRWLVSYLDNMAKEVGTESFLSATPELRGAIVKNVMSEPVSGIKLQLLVLCSEQEQFRRCMHITTIPHLRRIYLASGAPWRRRGYLSWPGIPGDPRAYTRQGPVMQC